jgi:zinc protease
VVRAARGRFVPALAALAAVTCGTAAPPPPARVALAAAHTLASGLRVVIEQEDRAPVAGVVLTVDVGSVDDPPGQHGMAHTLEHLVFRAPDAGGRSLRARLVRLGAASFNGGTGIERTTYWAFGPRQALGELLAAVLERAADPLKGVDEALLAKEAAVVAQELRGREGPSGLQVLMPALLPPGHPHARAWDERLETPALSLAAMRAFAERFYRPERMTLVLAGPVPPDVLAFLETNLPAAWRGRAGAPHRRPIADSGPLSPQSGERVRVRGPTSHDLPTHDTRAVSSPELWIGWRVPAASGAAATRLDVVARALDRTLSRRRDGGEATDVLDASVLALPGRLSSAIVCRLRLRSPRDAPRVLDETTRAIEALRARAGHETAVADALLRTRFGLDSLKDRAKAQAAIAHYDTATPPARPIDVVSTISAGDIADFVGRTLTAGAARAVLLVPEDPRAVSQTRARWTHDDDDAGDTPPPEPGIEIETETEPESDADPPPDRTPPAAPPDPALQAIVYTPGARAAVVRRLANGLSVIALRRPGAPFVSLLLGFHADPQPGDAPGARVLFDHAPNASLTSEALALRILRTTQQRSDSIQESLATFARSFDSALHIVARGGSAADVTLPQAAFTRWLDREAMRAATPAGQAARAFRAALFGDHPYRLHPTADEARTLTEGEARAWLGRVRRPANGVLVIVGDVDPEGAAQAADRLLAAWTGDATAPPPPPPPLSSAAARGDAPILRTNDPRRRSSTIRFACVAPPVRAPRDRIVHQLLAGMIKSNVLTRLRLGQGVTYGYDVDAESLRGGTAVIRGHVDVAAPATPDALELLRDWFDPARPSPITARRFEQQRWNRARRSPLQYATGPQTARALFNAWNMGWEPAVLDDHPRDLAGVTLNDVATALAACRKSAVVSVLGPEAP